MLPLVARCGSVDKGSLSIDLRIINNLITINEPIYGALVEEFVRALRPYGLGPLSISSSYGLVENCTLVSIAWRDI